MPLRRGTRFTSRGEGFVVSDESPLKQFVLRVSEIPAMLEIFARKYGSTVELEGISDDNSPEETIYWAASTHHLDAQQTTLALHELEGALHESVPVLVSVPDVGFVAVTKVRKGKVTIANPQHDKIKMELNEFLGLAIGSEHAQELDAITHEDRPAVAEALRSLVSREKRLTVWTFRPHPSGGFLRMIKSIRPGRVIAALLIAGLISQIVTFGGWWIVGATALSEHTDPSQLFGWLALLLLPAPLSVWTRWYSGRALFKGSAVFREFIFDGALSLPFDAARKHGAGDLLSRSQEFENAAMTIVTVPISIIMALGMLANAMLVLYLSGSGLVLAVLTTLTLMTSGVIIYHYYRSYDDLINNQLAVQTELVESVTGQLTKRIQGNNVYERVRQDEILRKYLRALRHNRSVGVLITWLPDIYTAITGIAVTILADTSSLGGLALAIGAVILGRETISETAGAAHQTIKLMVAFKVLGELFMAPTRHRKLISAMPLQPPRRPVAGEKQLVAQGVSHRYGEGRLVLDRVNFELESGQKIVLRGPSGGGKSTFAEIIAGHRQPLEGVILAGGLDQHAQGMRGWERVVAMAPQFHQNHIFDADVAFNLLMGRRWPASPDDIKEAERVAEALGLGDLIDSMPLGFDQGLGSLGWELSHGEKNRFFLARSILSGAPVLVLDESVSALDPDSVKRVMEYLNGLEHHAIILLAHP